MSTPSFRTRRHETERGPPRFAERQSGEDAPRNRRVGPTYVAEVASEAFRVPYPVFPNIHEYACKDKPFADFIPFYSPIPEILSKFA